MPGIDNLANNVFENGEFHFIRSTPYKREYLDELIGFCNLCILEIEKPDGTRIFAECKELLDDDVLLRITNEDDSLLSNLGTCTNILWFACTTPYDNNAPEDAVRIVQKASSFVGITDKPVLSNQIVFNWDLKGKDNVLEDDWWCATFVWDIFRMCGLSDIFVDGRKIQDCIDVLEWGQENNLVVDTDEGRYGDVVVYRWDDDDLPSHMAIIISPTKDGKYFTVDGCTSELDDLYGGHVAYKVRPRDNIIAVIRPRYGK